MNVFDTIKDSILSVPKDITTGIKALTTRDAINVTSESPSTSSVQKSPEHKPGKDDKHINYDAGSELLTNFQNSWSMMHKTSEENAKRAKVVDSLSGELFMYLERQKEAVGLFLQEMCTLPQLLHDLNMATEQIQSLEGQFEVVESELVKLEDTCERQELLRNMRHHEYQLGAYRQRRSIELEQAKVRMAKDHAVKVQRYESHLQKGLQEKQQAFEATFKEEIQHYKKYGKPSKHFVSPQSSPSKEIDISQFVPDIDPNSDAMLDEFLHVEVEDSNIGAQKSSAEMTELSDEGDRSVIAEITTCNVVTEPDASEQISVEVQSGSDVQNTNNLHEENIEKKEESFSESACSTKEDNK